MSGAVLFLCEMALLFGGPILLLIAVALGIAVWVFHLHAPWLLWVAGACSLIGAILLGWVLLYFRGMSQL